MLKILTIALVLILTPDLGAEQLLDVSLANLTIATPSKTIEFDLDGDAVNEVIKCTQKYLDIENSKFPIEGEVIVRKSLGNILGTFSLPESLDKITFFKPDNTTLAYFALYSWSGAHYNNIAVYGIQNGKLINIFG